MSYIQSRVSNIKMLDVSGFIIRGKSRIAAIMMNIPSIVLIIVYPKVRILLYGFKIGNNKNAAPITAAPLINSRRSTIVSNSMKRILIVQYAIKINVPIIIEFLRRDISLI